MAKEKAEKEKKLFVGVVWNYAAELKLLLTALLILCTLATLLQFIPSRFTISTSDLRFCISRVLTPAQAQSQAQAPANQVIAAELVSAPAPSFPPPPPPPTPPPPPPPSVELDQVLSNGVIKRAFNPYGSAAYSFVTMGAYRGGLNTFAIVGLASKPLHVFSNPKYQCQWVPNLNSSQSISTVGYKMLPDWGYGRVYTVVIVNCTFSQPINVDNSGGKLLLLASTAGGGDRSFNTTDTIEALTEAPGSLNAGLFTSRPKYDYLYCGSSLYGNLSPQRVREWIAYHVRLFGPRSHFVIHDAGGIHEEVLEVLKPWMELGYVTMQDIREQERFDGYYHNQFMVVNDCLHRYKFMAKWMFFFDVDEYIYMPPKSNIKSVLDSLSDYTQFTIEQMPMSNKLCLSADYGKTYRKWGFEKLVYKDVKRGIRRDRKYAVQPRNVYATGVHMSQNVAGKTTHKTENRIKYFHYHGTIANRREPCRQLVNATETNVDKIPYVMDTTMRDVAGSVKRFELRMIGNRLQKTRQ
ncbi:PREDICTED: galactan beta-1 [Prunus dulcis]|uniref:Glycosyltransferase family 92 protein n=1 Tax=Prunus dulcis TaxID=3755 RepID=A0A5E4F279_PRUDU|nr:galactan beta-1,4-galactosyltransferase GALS3-like [Prunus dulcis]VVA22097.1 PREDICTED: galactan beta-1 [Prunus dulcis]